MGAYPREGGFLPDEDELDFNLPTDELYVVIRLEWGGKFQSKFVVAPDATTAIEISGAIAPDQGQKISVAAIPWEKLVNDRKVINDKWKELTRRN